MTQEECRQPAYVATQPLLPTGPAAQLFIAGAAVFEITIFEPPVQRVTIVSINLPPPGIFGPYAEYRASISAPGDPTPVVNIYLSPTDGAVWAGSALLNFGGTLPRLEASVRPVMYGVRIGPVVLQGPVFH